MKTNKIYSIILVALFFSMIANVSGQSFTFEPEQTTINDSINAEMVFDFELTNTSDHDVSVVIIRTENLTPQSWSCSLCFFTNCYAPFIDTLTTTLSVGETVPFSVHVFALNEEGTATVKVKAYDEGNPSESYSHTLTANASLTSVEKLDGITKSFELYQNYPNPFNPSTKIRFEIPNEGASNSLSRNTKLVVYNSLGQQVAVLVDEQKTPGVYEVEFNSESLSSGIYLYKLRYGSYSLSKKMILEK